MSLGSCRANNLIVYQGNEYSCREKVLAAVAVKANTDGSGNLRLVFEKPREVT
jgi:hypothetical protein